MVVTIEGKTMRWKNVQQGRKSPQQGLCIESLKFGQRFEYCGLIVIHSVFSFIFLLIFPEDSRLSNQLSNKMFGPPQPPSEKILRLPQSTSPQSSLRICSAQQVPKDHHYCPFPGTQVKPKISIKQLLKKRSLNTQSYTSISQVSEKYPPEDPRMVPLQSQRSFVSPVRPIYQQERVQTVQNNNAFNYIIGECVIKPQQIRIVYHNSPPAKIEQTVITNQPKFNYPQPNKYHFIKQSQKIESAFVSPPVAAFAPIPTPVAKKAEQNIQKEKEKEKGETFNEFMSFGPKNFDLFKNMEALQINQITSHIVEETERTDLGTQDQNEKKRLTKTFSEAKIRKERERPTAVSQLQGRLPFARSNIFGRIKKTETMGGREDSDHESEVVEKFESLMQKVRENRLDNSLMDI